MMSVHEEEGDVQITCSPREKKKKSIGSFFVVMTRHRARQQTPESPTYSFVCLSSASGFTQPSSAPPTTAHLVDQKEGQAINGSATIQA